MKVIYNNKEIMNNTNNYETLLNLPMINSSTLQGVKTLNDINAYSKQQVDELISNSRAIEIVTALPTNLIENTLYYVGPDANEFYDVYLVDEVRNVINIGTSQFGEYFAGTGIDIDADNYISAKVDNKTLVVDSENNLHAVLDIDAVPVMVGATTSADGEKGLVPQPQIGDHIKALKGNGTWDILLNLFYPIGSIYLTYSNSYSPNTFFPGTTWQMLSTGRALWTSTSGGTNLASAVPNITGQIDYITSGSGSFGHINTSGAFKAVSNSVSRCVANQSETGNYTVCFDASLGTYKGTTKISQANSVYYKNTSTAQPRAIKICAWRRTA